MCMLTETETCIASFKTVVYKFSNVLYLFYYLNVSKLITDELQ